MKTKIVAIILLIISVLLFSNCATIQAFDYDQMQNDLPDALLRAVNHAFPYMSSNSNIAIVHISTPNNVLTDFMKSELENHIVGRGFTTVVSNDTEDIDCDLFFQLSGDIDNESIVRIGKSLGADILVCGRIDGEGNMGIVHLKLIDTKNLKVLVTITTPFESSFDFSVPFEELNLDQTIMITSEPTNAEIVIYDSFNYAIFGRRTPAEVRFYTVVHSNFLVVINQDGYQTFKDIIRIINRKLEPNNIHAVLSQVPTQQEIQTINITSNPPRGYVSIYEPDGKLIFTEQTPINAFLDPARNVPYSVVIRIDGFVQYEQIIRKVGNKLEPASISANMSKVQAVPRPTKPSTPTSSIRTQYSVGDKGPAGGVIFYDKGHFSDGWRYLEATSSDNYRPIQWGSTGYYVSGLRSNIGSGKENTRLIINRLLQLNETDKASLISSNTFINGYTDWFLLSKDELNQMFLLKNIIGGFSPTWYWSSSQYHNLNAWLQFFDNGSQHHYTKDSRCKVRLIRAF